MTREEKRERRKLRHSLQKLVRKNLSRDLKLYATSRQLKASGDKIASVLLSGKNPAVIQKLS